MVEETATLRCHSVYITTTCTRNSVFHVSFESHLYKSVQNYALLTFLLPNQNNSTSRPHEADISELDKDN